MADRHGEIPLEERWFFCYECQHRFATALSGEVCPECNGTFVEYSPQSLQPGDSPVPLIPSGIRPHWTAGSSEIYASQTDPYGVDAVSDLLERMNLQNPIPSPSLSPRSLNAYGETFEWDRVLTWFFENESSFSNFTGLPVEQIEIIPVSILKAKDIAKVPTCSICIDDFKLMEEVKNLPCQHFFHKECIGSWLKMRANCPVCRQTVKVEDNVGNFRMYRGAPDALESLREAASPSSSESSVEDDHSYPSSEMPCDYSAYSSTGGCIPNSPGTPLHHQGSLNDTIHTPADERISFDNTHSSWNFPSTNGSEYAVYSADIQPSVQISRHHAHYDPDQSDHSGHLPLDGRGSYHSTYSYGDGCFEERTFIPGLAGCFSNGFVPDVSSVSNSNPFQSLENVSRNSPSPPLLFQRSSGNSFFDDSSGGFQFSNSSSLEDLSSIVPLLPPIVL